ncbi:SigE family RNA polymerase sigma factor [Nocardioides mesophilus]|uniref:SigE family RNA polymerase sigma factor n=1 Tax=Nocardioides mesophilus TaxID=433659 RepID=A0A7G9RG13_9ACTN|nr:SigE family RNA polymerase sigma factor [Nocardioides mesophilus]QNN54538.1 SigE family RNA polymerase sigma factor [Nocardioides mesophilus]
MPETRADREQRYVDFVTGRWSALFRLAYLLTGSEPAAEDLLQTTLMKTYAAWARINRVEEPEAYVRRMLVNGAISESRRGWRRERATAELPEMPGVDLEHVVDGRADLWPVIRELPPRQRAVVVLRYYEDLSEEEIARVLGCSRGTVKSQASDAMRSLRRRLVAVEEGGSR